MPIRLSLALGLLALLRLNSSAVLVGSDDFNYANGPINNQSGGNGWNRAGGISLWSGGSSFPLVSAQVLYTGTNFGASRAYGADETNSAFYGSGMLFFRVTTLLGATVPSVAGMSSLDFGTEQVFFGRVTNTTFGISEPAFGTRALTSVTPSPNSTYTLVGVLDFDHRRLSLFVNPTVADFYNTSDGSSSAAVSKEFQSWGNWSSQVRLLSSADGANVGWDGLEVASGPADVGLQARGYLRTAGVRMMNANLDEVLLNGVNIGSWLFPEAWMMGGASLAYLGADTFEQLNAAVLDVMGGDSNLAAQVLGAMRSNYVTAADISFLASRGFNSVRVPFHYELFFQPTNSAASYPTNGYDLDTGFNYFDNLLGWCSSNGIYVIPNMHGVPGGEDYAVAGNVYTNVSNHALFLHVWQRIAARYATHPWIGGYDLINEPVNNQGSYALIPGTLLSSLYAQANNAIRSVDTNHMIICEGDWWATDMSQINTTGWTDSNLCYSDHRYGDALPFDMLRKAAAVGANVPVWMGEFGYNSDHWNNYAIQCFEQADTLTSSGRTATIREGHAYWSYKAPQLYVLAENPQTAGFKTVKNYWWSPSTVLKPSVTNCYNWLLQYAQGTLFSNCLVHTEVLDGLTRNNTSFATQRLPYCASLTIPGRIAAIDFDMGANGSAYYDTVYDDELGHGPGGRAWNDSWFGRNDGVDTYATSDPGTALKVGGNDPGEWQRYTVSCTPGTYNLNIRYSATGTNAQMHVLLNGINLSGAVNLPITGGVENYATWTLPAITVSASGSATLEIGCDIGGYDLLWVEFQPFGTGPLPPSGLTATPGNGAVSLTWIGSTGATNYLVKRSAASGGPYTTIGSASATSYHDTALSNSATYFYVISALNPGGASANCAEIGVSPQTSSLPAGWAARDVGIATLWSGDSGDVGLAGNAQLSGGVYTLDGSGLDIWGAADSFQFAYRGVSGDCTLVARVTTLQDTDPWAKAGIMIREGLQWDSPNAMACVTAQNGAQFTYRSQTAGSSSGISAAGAAPYWVRLVRSGNTVTSYRSSNGSSWSQIGSATVPMSRNAFVGLALTAHNNMQLATATFDNVTISSAPPPPPTLLASLPAWRAVTLTWSGPPEANSFNVKRSRTPAGTYEVIAIGVTANSYTDTGLDDGTTYYYVVSSMNLSGESVNSNEGNATTPAPPQLSTAYDPAGGQLTLSWPAWATNSTVYTSTNLASPTFWLPITDAAVPRGNVLMLTLPATNGIQFFRLTGQ